VEWIDIITSSNLYYDYKIMATQTATATKDQVTIPYSLLNDMATELSKVRNLYEQISLLIAKNEEEKWEMKSFTNVNDLFDELDN